MIPEYFMCEAERVDNEGTVRGYYRETQGFDCETLHLIHSIELGECEDYLVKPETVRRAAMKVIAHDNSYDEDGDIVLAFCPNCKLNIRLHGEYCFMCGQRLER